MAQTVPQQHPAVVLRTHYVHLRVLLVAALIALVAMAAAVVVLATSDSSRSTGTTSSPAAITAPGPSGGTRYDGGPEEGSRGIVIPPGSNYNGPH